MNVLRVLARRGLKMILAAFVMTAAGSALTAEASAAPTTCTPTWTRFETKYRCPLWTAGAPVYARANRASGQIDVLYEGGRANWFSFQCRGVSHALGPYVNRWWAFTLGDRGRWGYVPQVYFAGGANHQAARGLPTSSASCRT